MIIIMLLLFSSHNIHLIKRTNRNCIVFRNKKTVSKSILKLFGTQ